MDIANANVTIWIVYLYFFHRKAVIMTDWSSPDKMWLKGSYALCPESAHSFIIE